jgi:uncharacterized protein
MQGIQPVRHHEREIFMDVLRGFAILGIFIANLNAFSWYSEGARQSGPFLLAEWDHKMAFLQHVFIEGKFYSIFSLLFGWGIALQIKRGMDKGVDAIPTVRRRLLFMLLLGFLHLLIWNGDIVFFYALLGFILIPLRRFSNKTLLITGALMILSPILWYWLKMKWPVFNAPADWLLKAGIQSSDAMLSIKTDEDYMKLMQHGTWWDQLKANITGIFFRYQYLFFVSRIWKVLGMFLIGYVLGRSDFYKNFAANKKWVYRIVVLGLLIGLPANYMLAKYMMHHMSDYFMLQQKGWYQTIVYALGVVPLALAYVGIFMLVFQSGIGKKFLSILAPVGKMAFTNYIGHSLIGNFIFLGAGLGYMGKVGPVYYTALGLGIFIVQIIFSTIWLRYFNYGPAEWIWRSATYGKWQSMRRVEA